MKNSNKRDFQKDHRSGKNNKRDPKSRRKTGKDFTNEDKYDQEANKGKGRASNSPEWYGASSILMKDAAQLPFSQTSGLPISLGNDEVKVHRTINPGVFAIDVVTTPGVANDWSDPVNVAIRDIYGAIRSSNSGGKNYNAADLGMYFMAYDACTTYYAWMVRLYGILRTVILKNAYTPDALVQACGADYLNLVANMAQLRSYINTYAARLFAMRVPSTFHLLERHMWLFSHIFADAPVDKAQFYVFRPKGFWKYVTGTTSADTGLFLNEVRRWDYDTIVSFGDDLLNSILNSEDFNIMSGDIVRAYGTSVFTINPISEEYSVIPVYDPEVLMQIHNATVTTLINNTDHTDPIDIFNGKWRVVEDYSTTDNVGAIRVLMPLSPNTLNLYSASNKILDVAFENPDPTAVCLASRLMLQTKFAKLVDVWPEFANDQTKPDHYKGKCFWPIAYGTEIIVGAYVMFMSADDYAAGVRVYRETEYYTEELEIFNQHPLLVYINADNPSAIESVDSTMNVHSIQGDMNNYTVVDPSTLYNIHRAALLGMYGFAK